MANKFSEGDAVRITNREATAADTKSGLFYPHYSSLRGVVAKVYADNTASVNINEDTLAPDIRERHLSGSQAMRQKWLDGLSDEARNRLSAAEKKFALRYTILVSQDDLTADGSAVEITSAEPGRKSLADLEAEEARHLAEVSKKALA
jgi:hypothetical protein